MLKIKKKALLVCCKYNLSFLFRDKKVAKQYKAVKTTTKSIILRAPKHFNIGKQKILNLNYKTPTLVYRPNKPILVNSLLAYHNFLFNLTSKNLLITPTVLVNSVKFTIKTKFKLMWLEI